MTSRSTGLLFALVAVSIFSIQDGISKHLGTVYPPIFITMIRYWAFAGFVMFLASRPTGGLRQTAVAHSLWLQIGLGVLPAPQMVTSFTALQPAVLATPHTIFHSAPLFSSC